MSSLRLRGAWPLAALAAALSLSASRTARAHEPGEAPDAHADHDAAPRTTAPVLVERVEPAYPEAARTQGVGGTVQLELTVGVDGSVREVKVLHGAGFGFDESAVAAARRFRFKPAQRDGAPIEATVLFDQRFGVRPHLVAETTAEPAPVVAPPAPAPRAYQSTVEGRGPLSAASSSTIRNLDFDLRPKGSPNDILRVVPGLLTAQHQGGGKADQLFLRGFDADHGSDVAIFIDGVPINLPSHAHGQGYADLHFLIPEVLERIDVVKGPYDARYGDFATAGAINLVTRKGFDESFVSLTLGGYPTRGCTSFPVDCKPVAQQRFAAVVAPQLGGWAEKLHPWLAFELARDDGPFEARMNLYRYNVFGKLTYDLGPRTTIGLLVEAYGGGWIGSGQIPSREVDAGRLDRFGSIDPSEGGLSERQMVSLFFHHRDARNEVSATVYVTRSRLSLWNDFTFFLRDPVHSDEIEQDDARTVSGALLSYHRHSHWRSFSFRTTLGAQVRWDGVHLDLWDATSQDGDFRKRLGRHVDASRFQFGNDTGVDQLNVAGYVEEDTVWHPVVRTVVGLRADYFGFNVSDAGEALGAGQPATSGVKQKSLLSPKASVILTPWKALDLYLNFGMGFHSNDARIAVQEGRLTADGSVVNTVPRFYAGEIGARLTLWNRLWVAAALWASYLENETVFAGDAGVFVPSDPTRRLGVDVEVRAQPLPWLYLDLDLAQADATAVPDKGNGGAIALAPRFYLTGGVSVKLPVGVRAGFRVRYLADRPAFAESSPEYQQLHATDPRRVTALGYVVADLYGAYRVRWFEVALSIQNLFNAAWREAQFGNHSCTRDETTNASNPNYAACAATLPAAQRTGVADVHFTPGVPFNLQLTLKASF